MIRATRAVALVSAVAMAATANAQTSRAPAGPAQIVLIRHAEKPDDSGNPHLSPAGVARANRLTAFVTQDAAVGRFGKPAVIYATKTTKDDNGQRTQETVAPLAKALGLRVRAPYHGKQYAALAKLILGTPAYAGKMVVICWNHEEIPELAAALGVSPQPPKWKGSVYDAVYIISYRDGRAELTTSRYGDQ